MTHDRAALVEKVALAMYQADDYYVSYAHAIAAIDLIRAEALEEAARVRPLETETHHLQDVGYTRGWNEAVLATRAAIRALKEAPCSSS